MNRTTTHNSTYENMERAVVSARFVLRSNVSPACRSLFRCQLSSEGRRLTIGPAGTWTCYRAFPTPNLPQGPHGMIPARTAYSTTAFPAS
jgi:hypothetical protein